MKILAIFASRQDTINHIFNKNFEKSLTLCKKKHYQERVKPQYTYARGC